LFCVFVLAVVDLVLLLFWFFVYNLSTILFILDCFSPFPFIPYLSVIYIYIEPSHITIFYTSLPFFPS
jgi:hypothetical protein